MPGAERLTGADLTIFPSPNIPTEKIPECQPHIQAGLHLKLYRFSPSDYLELAAVFNGPHPETGEDLVVDDAMPEGFPPRDLPPQPAVFAPDYAREEITEIATKLRQAAASLSISSIECASTRPSPAIERGRTRPITQSSCQRHTRREAVTQSQGSPRDRPAADFTDEMRPYRGRLDTEVSTMLYAISRRLPHRIVAMAAGTLLAAVGLPAVAEAACPATATTKAFKRFGDLADYSLLSNGHFESGTSGWSLSGAAVVSGNESFKVHSSADTRSAVVQPTGRLVSPTFCVGVEHPTFRFFARQASGSWATVAVRLRWTESSGQVNETSVGSLNGSSFASWQPTPSLALASTLPLWQSGQSLQVQIVFDPEDYGGAWAVDDVYIDPYSRG